MLALPAGSIQKPPKVDRRVITSFQDPLFCKAARQSNSTSSSSAPDTIGISAINLFHRVSSSARLRDVLIIVLNPHVQKPWDPYPCAD